MRIPPPLARTSGFSKFTRPPHVVPQKKVEKKSKEEDIFRSLPLPARMEKIIKSAENNRFAGVGKKRTLRHAIQRWRTLGHAGARWGTLVNVGARWEHAG